MAWIKLLAVTKVPSSRGQSFASTPCPNSIEILHSIKGSSTRNCSLLTADLFPLPNVLVDGMPIHLAPCQLAHGVPSALRTWFHTSSIIHPKGLHEYRLCNFHPLGPLLKPYLPIQEPVLFQSFQPSIICLRSNFHSHIVSSIVSKSSNAAFISSASSCVQVPMK